MFGDIGDTRLGIDGGIVGVGLLGAIIGVVLRLLVLVVMAGLDGVVCGDML